MNVITLQAIISTRCGYDGILLQTILPIRSGYEWDNTAGCTIYLMWLWMDKTTCYTIY